MREEGASGPRCGSGPVCWRWPSRGIWRNWWRANGRACSRPWACGATWRKPKVPKITLAVVVFDMRICRRDLLLGAAIRGFAQEAAFSTEVKVVALLATVHDSGGAIVTNLNKEDFLVAEDGVPQTVKYFSRESDLP